MWTNSLPYFLTDILAAIFAIAAIVGIAAAHQLRERFRQLQHPRRLYRIMGELQLLTALFLSLPEMRVWGIVLAGFLLFWGIVALLNHRQWSCAVAGMLMMTALAPASLASTERPADAMSVVASR